MARDAERTLTLLWANIRDNAGSARLSHAAVTNTSTFSTNYTPTNTTPALRTNRTEDTLMNSVLRCFRVD